MRILIVDDDPNKYIKILHNSPIFASSKTEAYQLLQLNTFDIVFVNTKFNEDFVNKLRNIDSYIPIFLVNLSNDGKGIIEFAPLIDGYLINIDQVEAKIEKLKTGCGYAFCCRG